MKRLILFFLISISSFQSQSQNFIWEKGSYKLKCDTIIVSSSLKRIICLLENGTVGLEGFFRNGRKDSIWKNYGLDGKLLYTQTFLKSGIINEINYENKKITSDVFYKIDDSLRIIYVNTNKYYYKDGKTIRDIVDYGKKNAEKWVYRKSFNQNGNIEFEGFVSDVNDDWLGKDGVFYYYKNNKLKVKKTYEDNNLRVTEEGYYPNGNLEYKFSQYKNKLEGEHMLYFKNGNKSVYSKFKNGKMDGDFIIYKKDGRIYEQSVFKNGIRQN